jgi:TPR repeat protein
MSSTANPLPNAGNPFGASLPWGASGSFPAVRPNQPSQFSVDPSIAPSPSVSPVQQVAVVAPVSPNAIDEQAAVYKARKIETLMESANQGDSRAQWELFCRFQSGDGVSHSNREEAQKWLRMAATSGHVEAQFRLGKRLMEGEGMLASATAEGFIWIQKAAAQDYEPALVLLAICYEEGRGTNVDIPKAVHYYRRAVAKGNQHAQPRLSACYQQLFDAGIEAEGFDEWIESRAIAGDVDALYLIACQLCRTSGGLRLSKQVLPHLLGPAQQGNVKAQQALAQVYFGGKNPDDGKQAYYWINKAAEAGNRDALVQLAGAFKNGTGITRDPTRCVQLLQQAADSNHLDAQAILGTLMLIGDGIPRNLTRGITLLRNAASAGSTLAQWKFALCLKNGIGTVRDNREAEKWFDKAAEGKFDQGPPWQWTAPGLRFEEAIQAFHGLASMDHRQAHYWLGICFEHGIGVPRDRNKALDYYMKSANKGFQPAQEAAAKLKLAIS